MVGQSDEIFGVKTINWEDSSWKHLSLVGGEKVISLSYTRVYVFSDSVLSFGKMKENPQSNYAWEDRLEFEWKISQDSPHCSSATKSKSSCRV